MNKKALFICNTVYQVLVASWIKYYYYNNQSADIIISDHMNGYELISDNFKKVDLFDDVFTVKSKAYTSSGERIYKNKIHKFLCYRFPQIELNHYVNLKNSYDELFISNYDYFSQFLYDNLKRKNSKMVLNVFEDGLSTYSKKTMEFYNGIKPYDNKIKNIIFKFVFKRKYLYNNVNKVFVYDTDLLEWTPNCDIVRIQKIDKNDENFKKTVNKVFNYDDLVDKYDEKYIFFEEAYYADTGYMEDVNLIETIAKIVGKENMLIKIHPRNSVNRFAERGFNTNKDTAIPWEIIAMNTDIENKVLITIASSSIVNPTAIFDIPVKAYSLVNMLNEKPAMLKGELFDTIMAFYKKYSNINLVNNTEELIKSINS